MRGYTQEDTELYEDLEHDRRVSRGILYTAFDEEYLIPKIFGQFEKEYNRRDSNGQFRRPSMNRMMQKFGLSFTATRKLFRICGRRKYLGLNKI